MDLLKFLQKLPYAPPILNEELMAKFGVEVVLPNTIFPKPTFALSRTDGNNHTRPQAIAHRGHKIKFPENTIRAFEAAVEAGAHAVETDVHLAKDGTVVLSHDSDLKRCFGIEKKIKDCDWAYLSAVRTTREPHEPLARLSDLLELFKRPEWKSVWLMVDIKIDDEPKELMRLLAETFGNVGPSGLDFWRNKIVLGYWTGQFVPLCDQYFPGFSINNIGFSITYSRQFAAVSHTTFTMLQASLVSPSGRNFLREAQAHGHQTYAWTVNDEKNMDTCIRRGLDGVVTDNIPKFLEICQSFQEENRVRWPTRLILGFAYFNFWVFWFSVIFGRRYSTCIKEQDHVDKKKER